MDVSPHIPASPPATAESGVTDPPRVEWCDQLGQLTKQVEATKDLDPRALVLLEDARTRLKKHDGNPPPDEAREVRSLMERAALLAEICGCHYTWRTVVVGLGDVSMRVDHSGRKVAREVLPKLQEVRREVAELTNADDHDAKKEGLAVRFRELKLETRLLENEQRFERKRGGRGNHVANTVLDRWAKGNVVVDKHTKRKEYLEAGPTIAIAEQALKAARTGFDSPNRSWADIDQHLNRAKDHMDWYDNLRGDFLEGVAVTWGAYVPSVLFAEPFFRKMEAKGQGRWDQSKKIKDLSKLLAYKEVYNMLIRFLLMGKDYSMMDRETISGPIVEIVAGAGVTGAVTFGSSLTPVKSELAKAVVDACWGAVSGYFGGIVTWAAVPETARGGYSLHRLGIRAIKNCLVRYGMGHLVVYGYDLVQRALWGDKAKTLPFQPPLVASTPVPGFGNALQYKAA